MWLRGLLEFFLPCPGEVFSKRGSLVNPGKISSGIDATATEQVRRMIGEKFLRIQPERGPGTVPLAQAHHFLKVCFSRSACGVNAENYAQLRLSLVG